MHAIFAYFFGQFFWLFEAFPYWKWRNGGCTPDRYGQDAYFSFYSLLSFFVRKTFKMAKMCKKCKKIHFFGKNMRLRNKSHEIHFLSHPPRSYVTFSFYSFFKFSKENLQNGQNPWKWLKSAQKKGRNSPFFIGPKAHYWSFPRACVHTWLLSGYGQHGYGPRANTQAPRRG